MKFIGQCIVANAPEKPRGKFRVVKSITNPTRGSLHIVNGDYLPPAYTPSPPADNDPIDTSANDPLVKIDLLGLNEDGNKIVLETILTNRDNVNLTFYAHAYTENNIPFNTLSNTSVNRKSILVNANSETRHRFEFVQVVDNGSAVPISNGPSSTYYLYVFVTDSDNEHVLQSKSVNG